MKCDRNTMLLYAITDRAWTGKQSLAEQVESALKGGATCVQLREKELSDAEFLASAIELSALCKRYGVPFFVNDNVEIAIECGADGVHVGQDDMAAGAVRARIGENKILGVSAETVEQAVQAEKNGADYLGVGAMFPTFTKLDTEPVTFDTLKAICSAVTIPVVAIGGINEQNIIQLKGSGIAGVAVVSAIFAQPDITAAASRLAVLTRKAVE